MEMTDKRLSDSIMMIFKDEVSMMNLKIIVIVLYNLFVDNKE